MENRIRETRTAKGLRQNWVAENVGITPHYLWEVESGTKVGSIVLYAKLARLLGVKVDDLINWESVVN